MALIKCRLCGMLFNAGQRKYCSNCMRKLDELYGRVHEYMRDNEDEEFDIYTLADAMDITTPEVQALVELGYIERDLQTYGKNKKSSRQHLADQFNNELEKMKHEGVTTYGGIVYSRDNHNDERQYVFDSQKRKI